MKNTKTTLEPALRFNHFEGDIGQTRVLRDKIVRCRKLSDCNHCNGGILPKTLVRSRVELFDGEFGDYRWCETCTSLQARIISTDHADDVENTYEARCRTNKATI